MSIVYREKVTPSVLKKMGNDPAEKRGIASKIKTL
jgi:hypothetical protein